MYKKLLTVLVALLMVASMANATQVRETLIASTTLDADPTSITGDINIGDAERVSFFVTYSEDETDGGLSVAVTLSVSYDGTTFVSAPFFDTAGGATPQTSETISADGSYVCWLMQDLTVPYVRMTLTATGSDADDIATVIAYIVQDK